MAQPLFFEWINATTLLLHVTIQPGASRDEMTEILGGRLKIRIRAIPEHGKANQALCRFVTTLLSVPLSHCEIKRGATTRHKTLKISPIHQENLQPLLQQVHLFSQGQLDF